MGYYTDYTLEVCKGEGTFQPEELYAAVMKIDGGIFEDWGTNSWFANEQKWYSQDQDMYALSIKFPTRMICGMNTGRTADMKEIAQRSRLMIRRKCSSCI